MLEQLDITIGFATVMLGLSLIVTAATQAVTSALGLRGRDLRLGLEQLIKRSAPDLAEHAGRLSKEIVRHPLLTDSAVGRGRWAWASAIRREELLPILDDVLKTTGIRKDGIEGLAAEQRRAIDTWFESSMTRVTQWFVMHSRWITIAAGAILAVALHLDSGQLLRQLYEDSSSRARLMAWTSTLVDRTPGVREEMRSLQDAYRQSLAGVVRSEPASFPEGTDPATLPSFASRNEARSWIAEHTPEDRRRGLAEAFDREVDATLGTDLRRAVDSALEVQASLESSGLHVLPTREHRATCNLLWPGGSHFWGILASIALLGFGAPFWYNVLKSLSSLRPVLAQAADARAARTSAAPATPGQSTVQPTGGTVLAELRSLAPLPDVKTGGAPKDGTRLA